MALRRMARGRSTDTAERILLQALDLFNRFGEPHVSPAQISGMLGISPGNMYYHYPSKSDLVVALFETYTRRCLRLWPASHDIQNIEDAWFFIHTLFETISEFRFIYRDSSSLLSKNLQLENMIQMHCQKNIDALERIVQGLYLQGQIALSKEVDTRVLATNMALVLTNWLNFDYTRAPRKALERDYAERALVSGVKHLLHMLLPYTRGNAGAHLLSLSRAYV
jgi:AcrR family transcriptional regulator